MIDAAFSYMDAINSGATAEGIKEATLRPIEEEWKARFEMHATYLDEILKEKKQEESDLSLKIKDLLILLKTRGKDLEDHHRLQIAALGEVKGSLESAHRVEQSALAKLERYKATLSTTSDPKWVNLRSLRAMGREFAFQSGGK